MMKGRPLAYVFALSLALNAGVLGTMAYRHFTAPPLTPPTCPFVSGDQQRMYSLLGLSQEQRDKLDPVALRFHDHLRELLTSVGEQRDVLLTLIEQTPLDTRAIKMANLELSARQANVQNAVMAHLLEVKSVLTPEQQKMFFQLVRQVLNKNN